MNALVRLYGYNIKENIYGFEDTKLKVLFVDHSSPHKGYYAGPTGWNCFGGL
jgi:hypothetical protein